jgi:2-dehydro-3-deoxyphosphooctonate aldolase (KDO 8-P synthase)
MLKVELPPNPVVAVGGASFGNALPLALIAGPCALESREHALDMAAALKEIAGRLGMGLVYKTSFDKANRTSAASARGLGLEAALPVFAEIRVRLGVPVLTDVHEVEQCARVAEVVDVLQIPAFLCRQTDLLVAAAKTGRVVNVKKGQFLAPWDVKNVADKLIAFGCNKFCFTERGTTFGYNNLVADMRSLVWMREQGHPVIFDATHSVQRPGGAGDKTSGDGALAPVLARAAMAAGCDGIFMEVHEKPARALSDAANQIPLKDLPKHLRMLKAIHAAVS